MSKHIGVVLAALLIVIVSLVFLPFGHVSAGGWVANQGFEAGEEGFPREWAVTGNARRVDTPPIYSGNWSAQLTGPGDTLTQWVGGVVGLTRYDVWGWIYASRNVTGVIRVDFWQEQGGRQLSPTTTLSATDTAGAYVQQGTTVSAPAETTHVRIRLMGTDWGTGGEVRFDGIGFYPVRRDCFIASAAYGTPMAEEVQVLREFRDGFLLTNRPGQAFVEFYYTISPSISGLIDEYPGLRPIVRAALTPAVAISAVVVNTTPSEKAAAAGLVALASVAVVVWTARRRYKRTQRVCN